MSINMLSTCVKLTFKSYLNFSSTRTQKKQKFLFFFGPPGSGKGTYCQKLAKDLNYVSISTGTEIRKMLKSEDQTPQIKKLREIVHSGQLVPDYIVIDIIKQKLKKESDAKGFVFDAFPRRISELHSYWKEGQTDLVFHLYLQDSVIFELLSGRRQCVSCGKSFNITNIHRAGYDFDPVPPTKDNLCDNCGGKVIIRPDDTKQEVIQERIYEYEQETYPILTEYFKKGVKILRFEPRKGVKDYQKFFNFVKPFIDALK